MIRVRHINTINSPLSVWESRRGGWAGSRQPAAGSRQPAADSKQEEEERRAESSPRRRPAQSTPNYHSSSRRASIRRLSR